MKGNPFALAAGQTISYRKPDHSYTSAKRNYTNLALMQTHQKVYAEQRNIIEFLISLAKTWYNSQKNRTSFSPSWTNLFCVAQERGRGRFWLWQCLGQDLKAKFCGKFGSAGLCLSLAAAPGAPLVAWLRGTHVQGCALSSLTALHPARQYFCSPWLPVRQGSIEAAISLVDACGHLLHFQHSYWMKKQNKGIHSFSLAKWPHFASREWKPEATA